VTTQYRRPSTLPSSCSCSAPASGCSSLGSDAWQIRRQKKRYRHRFTVVSEWTIWPLYTHLHTYIHSLSGAGTNLKVGAHVRRTEAENFFVMPPHFLTLQVQLVVLVGTFVMVSTPCSFLFAVFLLNVPRALSFVKVRAQAFPCTMDSAPLQPEIIQEKHKPTHT